MIPSLLYAINKGGINVNNKHKKLIIVAFEQI